MPKFDTSRSTELLLVVDRDGPQTLVAQIEDQLRRVIRSGFLRHGGGLSSTRDLAEQLGVSRRVVVDAYAQLSAEGYIGLRRGARPQVLAVRTDEDTSASVAANRESVGRFDFRPSLPDVSLFPRTAWLRSLRVAVATISDGELGYGDPRGVDALRVTLADYLGRVRGVVAHPKHIVVTNGYAQSLGLVCHAMAARGATRIATENPSNPDDRLIISRAGLTPIAIGVDSLGIKVVELTQSDADAVIVTPAHQHPTGVVLGSERRTALLAWLRDHGAFAIEDDYDAEYRFDRAAVGSLQGLDPGRIIYAGSTSKTLAPALRVGWLVVPPTMLDGVTDEKLISDRGTARIEQYALADFIARGELDRHLRRMRVRYRARRDLLARTLAELLPEAAIGGAAAGLHLTLRLPESDNEDAVVAEARRRGVLLETMNDYFSGATSGPPCLLLGYGQIHEPAIRTSVHELALAVHAARDHRSR
jgi:GntR family transcriptional regulator / MocR family aminotransferase